MARNIEKKHLYESVKTIVETENPHIHLCQHKLFTLFSVAFQYLLFKSTKEPGAYIIRVEDRHLVDKLARKAKDESTRRFMEKLILPRRLKYGNSTFYLDYFQIGSWGQTSEIPKVKLKSALIVKNTTSKPMHDLMAEEEEEIEENINANLPPQHYYTSLREVMPQTIAIAFEEEFEGAHKISYDFISEEENQKAVHGVRLSKDLSFDNS